MGFFKSRKPTEEEETMRDLINSRKKRDGQPSGSADAPETATGGALGMEGKSLPPPIAKPQLPPAARARPSFGIEQAIELVAKLPHESPKLIISVLTTTLESVNVSIRSIIEDANHKEAIMTHRVSQLQKDIARMEDSVRNSRGEIANIEAQLGKFREVRNRLAAAIGFSGKEDSESKSKGSEADDDLVA